MNTYLVEVKVNELTNWEEVSIHKCGEDKIKAKLEEKLNRKYKTTTIVLQYVYLGSGL